MRRKFMEEVAEAQMLPLMNIIMLLIPFVLISSQFIKIGTINVSAPMIQTKKTEINPEVPIVPKPSIHLTISITHKGLRLLTRGEKLPENCQKTSKKTDVGYNFVALTQCLEKIKKLYPKEEKVSVLAEPDIHYQTLVAVMDASGQSKKYRNLFPKVMIAAGLY